VKTLEEQCNKCQFLRYKLKFEDKVFFCKFHGILTNATFNCKHETPRDATYSRYATIKDYK
jgi:hypothetical protein